MVTVSSEHGGDTNGDDVADDDGDAGNSCCRGAYCVGCSGCN